MDNITKYFMKKYGINEEEFLSMVASNFEYFLKLVIIFHIVDIVIESIYKPKNEEWKWINGLLILENLKVKEKTPL